jgi:hypothetical protein
MRIYPRRLEIIFGTSRFPVLPTASVLRDVLAPLLAAARGR